ncbi:MAG: cytochrome P450 [Myxococcota bacterium]|nr:cytochrome P450 [Myxococcota bacterium]
MPEALDNSRRPEPGWHGADPVDPAYNDDPYPFLERLREAHPVSLTPEGIWRLTRYDDCLRMLRFSGAGMRQTDGTLPGETVEQARQTSRGQFMLLTDPPTHTRLRKLVSKAFTPRSISAWRPRIEAVTDELLDTVAERGEMDLVKDLALPVPATLICEMLGVPVEDRDSFTEWTADATHGLALRRGNAPPDIVARVEKAGTALAGYFNELIAQRRGDPRDDLMTRLIEAEEEGDRLSAEELLIQSIGLLIAGFETTIGLIANGLTTLIRNPGELERLHDQPGLIESATEECLRYSGPITWTVRILHEPIEFDGYRMEVDEEVAIGLAAGNRDPAAYADPERFDVARFAEEPAPPAQLSFGGGAHLCLGAHLARLESQIAIGKLVERFGDFELLDEKTKWGRSLFRVPGRVPVRFRVR